MVSIVGENRTEWNSWNAMRHRCRNPKATFYECYGGRGIDCCDSWYGSFAKFLDDMGPKPSNEHSLDRIDGTKGYFQSNCRWATRREQSLNKAKGRKPQKAAEVAYGGISRSPSQWAVMTGLKAGTIKRRIVYGWTPGEALGFEKRNGKYHTTERKTDPENSIAAVNPVRRPVREPQPNQPRQMREKPAALERQKNGNGRPAWLKTPPPRRASTGKRR